MMAAGTRRPMRDNFSGTWTINGNSNEEEQEKVQGVCPTSASRIANDRIFSSP